MVCLLPGTSWSLISLELILFYSSISSVNFHLILLSAKLYRNHNRKLPISQFCDENTLTNKLSHMLNTFACILILIPTLHPLRLQCMRDTAPPRPSSVRREIPPNSALTMTPAARPRSAVSTPVTTTPIITGCASQLSSGRLCNWPTCVALD